VLRALTAFLVLAPAPATLGWVPLREVIVALRRGLGATLIHFGEQRVTAGGILTFALGAAITLWVSRFLRNALRRSSLVRRSMDAGTIGVFERLLHYGILGVGLAIALDAAGANLAAFFAAGAVFAVGIGFAMQNIAQNFVSGVILLVERAIKPGDVLEVEGQMVRVQRMGIRATIVRTLFDEDLIVPNATLVQGTVKNFTLLDGVVRVAAKVGVSYGSDLRAVAAALREAGEGLPQRLADRDVAVVLEGFGSSSVDFELSVWTQDPWRRRATRSELLHRIWWTFQERGITIAYPQLDVHLDAPVEEALRAR
jgi:small-conductance mechanosensitive channel